MEDYILYESNGIKIYIHKDEIIKEDKILIDRAKYVSDLANQDFSVTRGDGSPIVFET